MSNDHLADVKSLIDQLQQQSTNRIDILHSGGSIQPAATIPKPTAQKGHVSFKVNPMAMGEEETVSMFRDMCEHDQVGFGNALKLWIDTEAPLELQRSVKIKSAEPTLLHNIPYAPGEEVVPPYDITKLAFPTMILPNPYYSLRDQQETKKKTRALLVAIEQENEELRASMASPEATEEDFDRTTSMMSVVTPFVLTEDKPVVEPEPQPVIEKVVIPEPIVSPPPPVVQVEAPPPPAAPPTRVLSSKAGQKAREKRAVIQRFYENMEKDGMGPDTASPSSYTTVKNLGRGSQGVVIQVLNTETGAQFARKIIGIDSKNVDSVPSAQQSCDRIRTEITFTRLDCEYLLRSHGVHADVSTHIVNIDTPIMHSDLGALMTATRYAAVPEDVVSRVMFQVVSALAFLHSKDKPGCTVGQVFHRDLKPDNILLDFDGSAKVSDFGVAKGVTSTPDVHTKIGNQLYSSPEGMRHDSPFFSIATDIWSAGMITFHMLNGRYPLKDGNIPELYQSISRFDWSERDGTWQPPKNASPEALAFLSRTVVRDSTIRATAVQLLDHPFILKGKELLNSVVRDWMDEIKPIPR